MTLEPSLALRNTQQNHIAPIASGIPVKSPIKQLPKALLQKIQNNLKFTKDAPRVHLVCRSWYNLMPNNGHLNLCNSSITGLDLARLIKNYKEGGKLVSLNLSNCHNIKGEDLEHLVDLSLTQLKLNYCKKLINADLVHLTKLPLTQLDLCCCCTDITDAGLEHLGKITSLTQLSLISFKFADAGLKHLIKLPLTQLNLNKSSEITDAVLQYLAQITSLTQLDLSFCKKITDRGVEHLTTLPLTHLNLSFCKGITDACLEHLAKLPLKDLNIIGSKITERGYNCLQWSSLKEVNLRWGYAPYPLH